MDNVKFYGWQQDVIRAIDNYEEARDSELYQGVSDYEINRALGVSVALPRGSGHTWLANYIASKYPCVLVYDDMKHYQSVTSEFKLHPATETISKYEIYYALTKPDVRQPTPEFMNLRVKIRAAGVIGKGRIVVVDKAQSVSEDIKNFLFANAIQPVILLGH